MKLLFLQGGLYLIIGLLAPAITMLGGETPLTSRIIALMILSCLTSGAVSLKAFLSTNFADSKSNPSNPENGKRP